MNSLQKRGKDTPIGLPVRDYKENYETLVYGKGAEFFATLRDELVRRSSNGCCGPTWNAIAGASPPRRSSVRWRRRFPGRIWVRCSGSGWRERNSRDWRLIKEFILCWLQVLHFARARHLAQNRIEARMILANILVKMRVETGG